MSGSPAIKSLPKILQFAALFFEADTTALLTVIPAPTSERESE
jgi:hypothetical protein